jgi:formate hydrogenlyase subunit 3/multisubunit Na+/H+ antiporter MnhD subunit
MTDLLPLAVAVPLLAALLVTALPRQAAMLGVLGAAATTLAAGAVLTAVWLNGALTADLGGWGVPLGISMRANGFAAALLAMTALVALATSVYATGYFADSPKAVHFWPLWLLLWASLNALLLAADLFNLFVTLELLGLCAAALGALTGSADAVKANLRYLLVGLLGSTTYLMGVALLYSAYGALDIALLTERIAAGGDENNAVDAAALTLMTVGLALKAALFPLHFWLPPAHANAPAPVSAALSALVVKGAVYIIVILWLELFASVATASAAMVLGLLGAAGVIWGSWRALRAARLKLMAAYSTVAQIGYLFMFLPLIAATPPGPARDNLFAALVLMALSHGFAKAGFFLAAGLVQQQAGHDRIDDLGGTAQQMPATTFTIGLCGSALIGLPPSGSFIGKWLMMQGAIEAGQWWWIVVLLIGTLLAAAYTFRVLSRAFGLEPTPLRFVTDARSEIPALMLALTAVGVLGLAAGPLWTLLGLGAGGAA